MTFFQLLKSLTWGMALCSLSACGLSVKESSLPPPNVSSAAPDDPLTRVAEGALIADKPNPKRCQLNPNLNVPEELLATLTLPDTHDLDSPSSSQFHDNLGVGYLGPLFKGELRFNSGVPPISIGDLNWLEEVILPLHSAPNGPLFGWLACGQLILNESSSPTPLDPWIFFPGYSGYGFIILDVANVEVDGWLETEQWLQVRYQAPSINGEDGEGTAWISEQHLHLGMMKLGFVSWTDHFQHRIDSERNYVTPSGQEYEVGTLYFLHRTQSVLRAEPSEQANAIAWVEDADAMQPLLIEDDWMYVRLYQPSNFCVMDTWQGTVKEGWVRWMTPEYGNELGEPYKGC